MTFYLWQMLSIFLATGIGGSTSSRTIRGDTANVFEVLEESGSGTVIIDNLQHRLHPIPDSTQKQPYAAISNPSSPGIEGLEIRPNRFDGTLQLVVRDNHRGPDRERLCNTQYARKADPTAPCDITLIILHGDRQNPSYAQITLRILDVNDNTPTFPDGPKFELRIPEDLGDSELDTSGLHSSSTMLRNLYSSSGRTEHAVTLFALPTAFDNDSPVNGIKFYRLTTTGGQEVDSSMFALVNNSSEGQSASSSSYGSSFQTILSPALKVVGRLDREKVSDYWFHLLAVDGGVPQRTGTLSIHLVITDLNDNAPRFRKPIYHQPSFDSSVEIHDRSVVYDILRIPETLPQGTNLVTLVAEDLDQGSNSRISYRLKDHVTTGSENPGVGMNPFGLFQANDTVTLQVLQKLDADGPGGRNLMEHNRPIYGQLNKIIIEAVDHGSPPLTGTITLAILVENVNDNRPDIAIQFTDPLKLPTAYGQQSENVVGGLMENAVNPVTIAHLTVTDGDVVSQELSGVSQVDGVRCDTNDTRFVLEQMQSMSAQGVTDRQSVASSHASLSLYFYRMSAIKSIDREQSEWIYVQITCVDQVRTDYGTGSFSFAPISSYTSSVQLTGTVVVTLKILDANDNIPRFDKEVYHFSVLETPDKPTGYMYGSSVPEEQRSRIGSIRATDADSGNNGLVQYRLLTNPNEAFYVDERSGELWRVGSLDREREAQLELRIEARDKGEPALTSTCLVRVKILDINDHAPYWVTSSDSHPVASSVYRFGKTEDGVFYFSVYENLEVGSTIGSVQAVDLDGTIENELVSLPLQTMDSPFISEEEATKNVVGDGSMKEAEAKIVYQIESVEDARLFSINWHTGEMRLNQKLDRETRAHYELRVFAVDNPPPTRWVQANTKSATTDYWERIRRRRFTATATIIITVLDVNDNAPQFDSPLVGQEFHLEPGSVMSAPGTTLFTAKAHDADAGENATVRYMLEGGGYDLVEIDPTTGVCYLREAVQPQKLLALLNKHELPLSERVLNSHANGASGDEQSNELRSLSLSLTVIAYDTGKPRSLNNSRTVRLVWNGGDPSNGDLHAIYARKSLFGQAYNTGLFGGGKLSYSERLLIPLIVGAFLLLFIICLILFGIFRYRRQSKRQRSNPSQSHIQAHLQRAPDSNRDPTQSGRAPWLWCLPTAVGRKDPNETRANVKHEAVGQINQQSEVYLTDSSAPYKSSIGATTHPGRNCKTSLDVLLPNCYKSYLPDCIPSSEFGVGDPVQMKSSGHIGTTPKRASNHSPGYRPRYAGGRLSRAFSEESLSLNRPNDLGYTALCAYPSALPEHSAFLPGIHRADLDSIYFATDKRADQLNFSPFTNRRGRLGQRNASAFTHSRPTVGRVSEPQAIYSPLSVATTCQVTYPTFQALPAYGSAADDATERYEAFELGSDLKTPTETNQSRTGSGWKSKISDAYAENTFV